MRYVTLPEEFENKLLYKNIWLSYSFSDDTLIENNQSILYDHGIINNISTRQEISKAFFQNSRVSIINTTCSQEMLHEPLHLPINEYDTIIENINPERRATLFQIFNEVSPFFGRVWTICYIQSIIIQKLHYGSISFGVCYSTPHFMLDYYKFCKEYPTYMFSDFKPAYVFKQFVMYELDNLKEEIPEDVLLRKLFSVQAAISGTAFDTRSAEYLLEQAKKAFLESDSFWFKSGVSFNNRLIYDFSKGEVVRMIDTNDSTKSLPLNLDSFKNSTGILNTDGLYLVSKQLTTPIDSVENMLTKLRIYRG